MAVKQFDGYCIFQNRRKGIGAHIFSAGIYPELARYPVNIVCVIPELHYGKNGTLDTDENGLERNPVGRIELILRETHIDMKHIVRPRIEALMALIEDLGVYYET